MSENDTPVQTNRLNFGSESTQESVQSATAEVQTDAVVEETDGVRNEDTPVIAGEPESNEAYQEPAVDQEQDQPVTEATVAAADLSVGDVVDANEAVIDATADAVGNNGSPVETENTGTGTEAVSAEAVEEPRVEVNVPGNTEDEASVAELKQRQADLEAQISARQKSEKDSVLAQVKTVLDNYNITTNEVVAFLGGYKATRTGVPAKPKYRNPADGKTWSGRGKPPLWIKDQDRTKFLITE